MFEQTLRDAAAQLLDAARGRGWHIATAESCTGGLIAGCLTAIAGSSDVVLCGFVTYDNGSKSRMLGVPPSLIERDGAVSESVARAMAEGACANSPAELSLACTGIAGPGGGSAEKPVGRVHIAAAAEGRVLHLQRDYGEIGRDAVRAATVADALALALRLAREPVTV
ncbi:CinA family protein [Marinibaculum pumilum]|uniref:CinA family protein n=1 Tax=Marinibaculum pumilum TaxID=1766165 RepID=A0ABV7KUD3_9PROT